ncbi:hypothetical protein [Alcanivorax sp. DP30]|uniref:hypothetical protein n=1 Tax=Alcanivorax sp. DP30 TaxID=2606217 RepID=UPI0013684B0F|nr:hypothetical protein [Alcanivorax sp. DP30]MZR62805.1 hypothetical protein [Alcanivorax sp. DP30]
MGAKFRAVRITSEAKLEDIAETMQRVIINFSNPINFSCVFYRDPREGETIVTMVAFQNKDAFYLDRPDPVLRSSFSSKAQKTGFLSNLFSKFGGSPAEQDLSAYISRIVAVATARQLSSRFNNATAHIVSDTLCECGHITFQNGVAASGVLVGPDGTERKVSINNGSMEASEYSVGADYQKYFFDQSNMDLEEFLASLEYLGRIQIMAKKELIPNTRFELEKT